jgi:phosphoribosylanthranilate isomerase
MTFPVGSPPLVKICGLRSVNDALEAARAGADWIGLNFHPKSARFVAIDQAAEIVRALPETTEAVGLFVNRPVEEIREIARATGLRIVQLHGDELVTDAVALANAGLRVVRAFRVKDAESIAAMTGYLDECLGNGVTLEGVLVDAYVPGLMGGTGQSINDELLERLPPLPRLILAGGLTPENAADRIARARPWMVDVAGGVESAPGRKDLDKVRRFIQAARSSPDAIEKHG